MRIEWRDLSDSELRAKLEQRGIAPAVAKEAVKYRDQPQMVEEIERVLNR